ncbi:7-carboxy-7-deazaguanine synthase QueE [Rhizobium sp. WYJ-E13]|uniref:7-carboxy-7-deazaguanine synthase QueE n=1 Tax=Rhizobium sp. WYJ-E13 TaxID=2849093 RepID=UPI0020A75117|nr:7-carboxy-7-deazaguanine synthase QueE [Rhizobium sp. WYJ-E13]
MIGKEQKIRISEIFGPTIQGEGPLMGLPTVFVRTGGCDYRCKWCDTLHAVDSAFRDEWTPMSVDEVWSNVELLSQGCPLMVSLSGGNPAIQPFAPLIARGKHDGYQFALETQGSIAQDWFAELDHLILSPKPPSSGMEFKPGELTNCITAARNGPRIAMKIVIFNEDDYAFARSVARDFKELPIFLQPGNHTPPTEEEALIDLEGILNRMRWLVDRVTSDRWFDARVLPQLHVLLWGNMRGV